MKHSKMGRICPPAVGLFVVVCGSVPPATSAQTFQEFPIPNANGPNGITAGPDGNLWFTAGSSWVGYISTSGAITEAACP